SMAGFDPESGVACMAGFAGARRPHPGRHTTTPAVFRYPLAVSLRTPVASSMRRKDHPSFPRAITCCFFSSLKTLLMPREPIRASLGGNVPGFLMAGFQVTLYGRFWVTAEAWPCFLFLFQSSSTLNGYGNHSFHRSRPSNLVPQRSEHFRHPILDITLSETWIHLTPALRLRIRAQVRDLSDYRPLGV